jgi:putative endonuclease
MRYRRDGELIRYFVYILSNNSMTLYTGVTGNLRQRMATHASKTVKGFTSRYHFDRLVYFEELGSSAAAIAREKQIKGWNRKRKIALVKSLNPRWEDLSGNIFARNRDGRKSS